MLRREMAVPRRHRDRLVTREFLNLLDRRARHRQPGAERVTVAVPDVAFNLRVFQAGYEPGAGVESRTLAWEDRVRGLVQFVPERLKGSVRVCVKMDGSGRAILCLRQVNGAAVEMDLSPGERVLLRQAHSRTDGDDELGHMLREAAFDDLVELVVLLTAQEAETTRTLAAVANLPGGVDGCLVVMDALAVAEGDEGLISVAGGGRLAVGAEPAFDLLGREVSGRAGAEGLPDDLGLADIAAAVLVVGYELQCVVDQLGETEDLAIAQLRQLAAGGRISFAALVKLNGIGLATDLLTMSFPSGKIVDPPNACADWFSYIPRIEPSWWLFRRICVTCSPL